MPDWRPTAVTLIREDYADRCIKTASRAPLTVAANYSPGGALLSKEGTDAGTYTAYVQLVRARTLMSETGHGPKGSVGALSVGFAPES